MLFNSIQFLIFFPVVTALYFALPNKARWAILLAASSYFYMAFRPLYILILAFTILVDYVAGLLIDRETGPKRKFYLIASLVANVGVLAFFKYYNFLTLTFQSVGAHIGWTYPLNPLDIILPIGLSFHTFQSMSYTIEVYRRRQKPEKHLGIFALYVMFYPQLVAGPIERPQHMLHQFHEFHRFEYPRAISGLQLMAWGLYKKIVVADRIAPFVNQVYDHPSSYPGVSFIIATVFFAFQIYCDFSGYSDIAVGSAQVMGFKLMENFRMPYFSPTVGDFWRRWHISLSTWFRDYVYFPLGGNRVLFLRRYSNVLITFLVSGLWHGANWTYVIWGGLNGLYLVLEQGVEKLGSVLFPTGLQTAGLRLPLRIVRTLVTFALICFAWIFFRARTTADAFFIAGHLGSGLSHLPADLQSLSFIQSNILMRLDKDDFEIALVSVAVLLVVELAQHRVRLRSYISRQPAFVRWSVYYACCATLLFFGAFNKTKEFIYFQF